jgi:hypothetical protein
VLTGFTLGIIVFCRDESALGCRGGLEVCSRVISTPCINCYTIRRQKLVQGKCWLIKWHHTTDRLLGGEPWTCFVEFAGGSNR